MEGRHFGPLPRASKTLTAPLSLYPPITHCPPFPSTSVCSPSRPTYSPTPYQCRNWNLVCQISKKIANLHVCVCFSSVWLQNCGRSSCTTALKVVQRQNTRLPRSFRHKRRESIVPPQRPVDILEIISDLAGHPKASKGETLAIFYRPIVFLSPNEQCQGTDRAPRVPLGFKNASVL